MASVTELKTSEEHRLSMADQNFLTWLEMTSALPHAHIHAVFDGFKKKLTKYQKRTGQPVEQISVPEVIAMFMDHVNKMGSQFGTSRYMSVMYGNGKSDDD
ncbi:MAG: hypothetical protein K2Q12_04980 [Rickettsiales bacterium]|nr:hypothetical protein [Rickettsiales bacterium]